MTQIGVYVGNDPSALAAYSKWAGIAPANQLNYLNHENWSEFDNSIQYEVDLWKDVDVSSIWSVPLTVWGTSLEQVASGSHNSHFLKAALGLSQTNLGSDNPIYIRVGWEFNGTWFPWAAAGHEEAFIAAFRELVTTFRTVSDRFEFVWDVNIGGNMDVVRAYPGDEYVDIVGIDTYYNLEYDSLSPEAAFNWKVAQPFGLQWQQDFAVAHGKATAVSEWGVMGDKAGPFVREMVEWISRHEMIYENYWDSDGGGFPGKLSSGQNSVTGEVYRTAIASLADIAADTGSTAVLVAASTADAVVNAAEAKLTSFSISGLDGDATALASFSDGTQTKEVAVRASGTGNVDLSGFNGSVTSSLAITDLHGNMAVVTGNTIHLDTTADAGPTAVLVVAGIADHVVNAAEAKLIGFSISGLDGDATGLASFSDGTRTKEVAVGASGKGTVDLSGFNGSVRSSLAITDRHGNMAVVTGNTIQLDTTADAGQTAGVVVADSVDQVVEAGKAGLTDPPIFGLSGSHMLVGGGGDDVLISGSGYDVLLGGLGNDLYAVTKVGDAVVEGLGGGVDQVYASVDYGLSANVENLFLLGSATMGIGNASDNYITSALEGSVDNVLIGGGGNDHMVGGLGDDLYEVMQAGDAVIEAVGEGTDQVYTYVDHTLGDNIENLFLVGSAGLGIGNAFDNYITAILEETVDNVLIGGGGNDQMLGGLGNDLYEVTEAGDSVTESAGQGTDQVYAYVDYALTDNIENLFLVGSATSGTGNSLANYISAGLEGAVDNVLNGGGGNDVMVGGLGNDLYAVTEAGDIVVEAAGAGGDQVYAFIDYVLSDNVENLFLAGSAANGTGNALSNYINAGLTGNLSNVLNGGAGNDVLVGGGGTDTFVFTGATFGQDAVLDFSTAEDQIVLSKADFTDFGSIMAHASQMGTSTVIELNAQSSIMLEHVSVAELQSSSFYVI